MIGVILAAGVGSRLRPITNNKPKCLVSVAGKPILQFQIDAYIEAGISELIIIVGYEKEAVKEYCKHIKNIKINIIDNDNYENTNNMYSLYLAKNFIYNKSFILNNADLAIDKNILTHLIKYNSPSAVAIDTSIFNDESMKVTINSSGYISDISKQISQQNSAGCSIDFYKFSSQDSKILVDKICHIIEKENNLNNWTEVAMQQLFQANEIKCLPCDIAGLRWVEIDNYDDLAIADKIFSGFDQKFKKIESIIFDLDGTLYIGNTFIDGASDTLKKLKQEGKNLFFVSNNSSKDKSYYINKLKQLYIQLSQDQIILSTDGIINYCLEKNIKEVYILGTQTLHVEFQKNAINPISENPEYVIIGYDTELDYQKVITACKYINHGADILLTHPDIFCPTEEGPIPDVGAIAEMIAISTGKRPVKVFGKPNAETLSTLIQNKQINPDTTLIIGDRLHTDIKLAQNTGCYSMVVLSGETSREKLENAAIIPDFILRSVKDIY